MQSSHLIFSERGSQSFAVDILDDTTLEDSEMFSIMLLNPRPDAVMFTSNTIIVIVNDNDCELKISLIILLYGQRTLSIVHNMLFKCPEVKMACVPTIATN